MAKIQVSPVQVVNSDAVVKFDFDKKNRTLAITYRDDGRVEYYDVPPKSTLYSVLMGEVILTQKTVSRATCH